MRNSFIFYKSFADAIMRIEDEAERARAYDAIIKYAIYGEETMPQGLAGMFFDLAKPQIDANNMRYENGKKGAPFGKLGGRPKKQTTEEAEPKPEPKPKADKPAKVQEEKMSCGEMGNVKLTKTELDKLNADYGEVATAAALEFFDEYIAEKGYKSKSHYLAMRRWVFDAVKEKAQKRRKTQTAGTVDDYFAERGVV